MSRSADQAAQARARNASQDGRASFDGVRGRPGRIRSTPPTPLRSARLWGAVSTHGIVDFFSFLIVPLMTVLEGRVHMTHEQGALVIASGSISSGLIQPLVAFLSDRLDTRWLGTIGFGVAVIALGLLGSARNFGELMLIQVVAAAGLGAFHPVCAAAVGHMAGPRRSLAVALFYASGMLGGMLGNIVAPAYVSFFGRGAPDAATMIDDGMHALRWLIIPGLAGVALLAWAIHSAPHRHHGAASDHAQLPAAERRARWRAVWVLWLGNLLRFAADICVIQLVIRWMERTVLESAGVGVLTPALRADAAHLNGPMQAAKQLGMGVAGIALGLLLSHRHDKRALFWGPLMGGAFIAALPHARGDGWVALLLCACAGVGYAGVIPITISLAQRLLPHRTGLASGLMMGGAWSISSFAGPGIQWLSGRVGLEWSFAAVGGLMVLAAGLALLIPGRLIARVSGEAGPKS